MISLLWLQFFKENDTYLYALVKKSIQKGNIDSASSKFILVIE